MAVEHWEPPLGLLEGDIPPATVFKATDDTLQLTPLPPFLLGGASFLSLVFHFLASLRSPGIRHRVSSDYWSPAPVESSESLLKGLLCPLLVLLSPGDIHNYRLRIFFSSLPIGMVSPISPGFPLGCLLENFQTLYLAPSLKDLKFIHIYNKI